ncbi:HlyD family type I secretion periplasmic adaptor subunit [Sneathiella chungangensis]|uniref:Membrane fusion protein (MFP) family protein n=1 Tax=Sneathiella chungangensis TaxID=1418234 RepID=A0A845MF18_9PROT|nr:HlyD family type I secretion periplasmic adaptor subunit [Sneathiella chungangensis]MZR21990.1 HlyD family type I secretion periplasmic adaptor subunit [Sneathiella chungangensis]
MSTNLKWDDSDFASDVVAAKLQGPHPRAYMLLFGIVAFFVVGYFWASNAVLDEVTRGDGKVIPSSQVQIIQNLEGGILRELLVHEGDIVEKGQIILRIDDTGFASRAGEIESNYLNLMGRIARLEAEATGEPLTFPAELLAERKDITVREQNLFNARQAELQSQIQILRQQAQQRQQEIAEINGRLRQLRASLALANEEMEITEPLVKKGIVPKVDSLKLRREVNDLRGQISASELSLPRVEGALKEANQRIEEKILSFKSGAAQELSQVRADYEAARQAILGVKDRVARTDVRSPVAGEVKDVKIQTIGGVVKPGQDIIEIVPIDDTLLVEANIRPSDIAFLRPGQEATVKITAYDYSIYGGLPAKLERISADTIVDEKSGESYYQIIVRTDQNYLKRGENTYPIIPGMVASVDILTGHKTVLDYILKPILKTRDTALRER